MKKVFIAIGAIGLGYGIYQYYLTQGAILYNYKYKILGVIIKKVTTKEVELQIDVEVVNDSAISATLTNYYFDIFLNEVLVQSKSVKWCLLCLQNFELFQNPDKFSSYMFQYLHYP